MAVRKSPRPTREDVRHICKKKLHNEELHNLKCSPNIILAMKSRRMKSIQNFDMKRADGGIILK